jgi:hypothetical protein
MCCQTLLLLLLLLLWIPCRQLLQQQLPAFCLERLQQHSRDA